MKTILSFVVIFYLTNCISATLYSLPEKGNRLIGINQKFTIPDNNTHSLEYFAKKFNVGLRNILQANPEVDLYLPQSKQQIIIPKQLILPNISDSGIIINSAEMRLYFYPKNNNTVIIFPIAIGTINHETPSNWTTSIKYKKKILFGFQQKICVKNTYSMEKYYL